MGFIYGLAMVLVISEGIIIQCDGGDLPNHLIEVIIGKTDYHTLRSAVEAEIIKNPDYFMSGVLENSIIYIEPAGFNGQNYEFYRDGDLFVKFGSYRKLKSFFDKFGDKVKKIEFDNRRNENYNPATNEQYNNIVNHIKNCSKNLVELRLNTLDDERFWTGLYDDETGLVFPEVKKFEFYGQNIEEDLDLNLMFPKLESLALNANACDELAPTDVNCLDNVKGLKELELISETMEKEKFEHIFKNNKDITKIDLIPYERTTVQYIAEYLTKLKTLKICWPSEDFWLRADNDTVYKLPSVTHFHFITEELDDVTDFENISFDMPHLKKLTLMGVQPDDRTINYIKHFEELETLEIFKGGNNSIKFIEKLEHIKEIMITISEDFFSLAKMFKNIGENSKLQILKIVYLDTSLRKIYEAVLGKLNEYMKKSIDGPSRWQWTLSHVVDIETPRYYFMFRREP